MSAMQVVRKELLRRRFSTVVLFCVIVLVFLLAGALYPRTWTAEAVLGIQAKPPEFETLSGRLRQQFESASSEPLGDRVGTELRGSELRVRFSANDPQRALEELSALLSRVVRSEIDLLREGMRRQESELQQQLQVSAATIEQAAARLDEARLALLEGGESALGARIGQLQGESEALELDLRTSRELQATLRTRSRELSASIESLQPAANALSDLDRRLQEARRALTALRGQPGANAARVEDMESEISTLTIEREALAERGAAARSRIAGELEPQRRDAEARLATLATEIAAKQKRQADVAGLLEAARAEISALNQDNQQLRELQRAYDDAVALDRQLKLRLQAVRDDIVVRATPAALPFEVLQQPMPPRSPDGLAAWLFVLLAVFSGLGIAFARLLGTMLVDDRVRLPETLLIDAELPVLAQIPDYRPSEAVGKVRWAAVSAGLLFALTGAACGVFLLVFG